MITYQRINRSHSSICGYLKKNISFVLMIMIAHGIEINKSATFLKSTVIKRMGMICCQTWHSNAHERHRITAAWLFRNKYLVIPTSIRTDHVIMNLTSVTNGFAPCVNKMLNDKTTLIHGRFHQRYISSLRIKQWVIYDWIGKAKTLKNTYILFIYMISLVPENSVIHLTQHWEKNLKADNPYFDTLWKCL